MHQNALAGFNFENKLGSCIIITRSYLRLHNCVTWQINVGMLQCIVIKNLVLVYNDDNLSIVCKG